MQPFIILHVSQRSSNGSGAEDTTHKLEGRWLHRSAHHDRVCRGFVRFSAFATNTCSVASFSIMLCFAARKQLMAVQRPEYLLLFWWACPRPAVGGDPKRPPAHYLACRNTSGRGRTELCEQPRLRTSFKTREGKHRSIDVSNSPHFRYEQCCL
jgi:hypothetical protein